MEILRHSGSVFGFDDMPHEDGVAGIRDDEEEKWMVDKSPWWATLVETSTASCSGGFSPFFVDLKR